MSTISEASVPTTQGLKYLQQLCKHWAHNLAVILDETSGRVIFPANARGADWPGDAVIIMTAAADHIQCRIEASAEGQLDGLKGALARHLDRFAFREAPLSFQWTDI
jgi:hypothetical protein